MGRKKKEYPPMEATVTIRRISRSEAMADPRWRAMALAQDRFFSGELFASLMKPAAPKGEREERAA